MILRFPNFKFTRWICLLTFFLIGSVFSQTDNGEFSDVYFREKKISSSVLAICRDSEGFFWFGTSSGLVRYDGLDFTVYQTHPLDSLSLSSNIVTSIISDPDGFLWVGTSQGLNKFDPRTDQFVRFFHTENDSNSLFGNEIIRLYLIRDNIYICTSKGLNAYHIPTKTMRRVIQMYALSVHEDKQSGLWIGTYDKGLIKLSENRKPLFQFLRNNKDPGALKSNRIYCISEDRDGLFWLATQNGIHRFDPDKKEFMSFRTKPEKQFNSQDIMKEMISFKEHEFLVATWDGVFAFDKTQLSYTLIQTGRLNDTLPNFINSIHLDTCGTLWVSSNRDGLRILNPGVNKFANPLNTKINVLPVSHLNIISIVDDNKQFVWFGTNDGLYRFDKLRQQYRVFRPDKKIKSINSDKIYCLHSEPGGILWIGTNGGGLNRMDVQSESFENWGSYQKKDRVLNDNQVNAIEQDSEQPEILWLGTTKGITRFDKNMKTARFFQSGAKDTSTLSSNLVISIKDFNDGYLWIGTVNGLNRFDKKKETCKRFYPKLLHPLSNNQVRGICKDRFDSSYVLWLGTYGSGIMRFDMSNNTYSVYNEKKGLCNDFALNIVQDDRGDLWISTNNGLSRFNPRTEQFRNYYSEDGLLNNNFLIGYFKNKRGELYFGGKKGLNVFHPDSIKDSDFIPPVYITKFKKFNQEVKLDSNISHKKVLYLTHRDYVFSFEFASLDYLIPQKNQYAYKMDGFDEEWIYSGTRTFVNYTNLDPGEYVFRVKGTNHDGVWNEEGTSLKVIITPPYYQTWWFRTLMVIFAGLVVVFAVQWRKYYKEYRRLRYISHFKIVRKLGEGGMGEVYQAKNFITGDSVALKLLHPKLTAEESNKTRFLREAKLMSDLQHPNIVKIYETGEAAGRGYISMELLEGMTLSEFIKKSGYLSSSIAVDITLAACEALSFIHQQGVIHRDIKSENIFILQPQSKSKSRFKRLSKISQTRFTWPERVRLMDFGLAKSLELMTITQVESIIGTIAYMSPEQASGRSVDQRSDVYSLGVVLYEALTGHLPHESDNDLVLLQAVMDGRDPKPMESHGVEIPELIKDIVLKMLKKYPDERYQSIDEVKTALTAVKGVDSEKQAEPIIMKPSPASLSRQSMVYLSKGELSKALEASQTAVEYIRNEPGSIEAEVFFNHYKVLSTAGKGDEAVQYMNQALSRIATAGNIGTDQSGDKSILIEYNTRKWKKLFQEASEHHRMGHISEARILLLDAVSLIKQSILLIENEQDKSYYAEANNVSKVIQLLNQLMN